MFRPSMRLRPEQIVALSGLGPLASPVVEAYSWGRLNIAGRTYKDAKLFPGGARAWDWNETGTRHVPGVQVADALELLDRGAEVLVLSRGVDQVLEVPEATVDALRARGVEVHVAATPDAIDLYNRLCARRRVAALLHSTC